MVWHFEKFVGDMAVYGICPKCGFRKNFKSGTLGAINVDNQYNYCPACGEYLYAEKDQIHIIVDKNSISSLYE